MLHKHGAVADGEEYNTAGKAVITLRVDEDKAQVLQQAIADATSGQVQAELLMANS